MPGRPWRQAAQALLACLPVTAGLLNMNGAALASATLEPLFIEPDQGCAPIIRLIGSAKHSLDFESVFDLKQGDRYHPWRSFETSLKPE